MLEMSPWRIWVLAALVVALLIWVIDSSQSFQSCVGEGQNYESGQALQESIAHIVKIYRRCVGAYVVEKNPAITAIATALLAIITFGLVHVARRQIKTTEAQLRAYVFGTAKTLNIECAKETGNPTKIIIQYETKNWGQTPAYRIRNASFIRKMPWPLTRDFVVKSPKWDNPQHVTLAPGQGMFQDASATYETLPKDQRYYIIGLIEYFDGFSRRCRRTKFCVSVDVEAFLKRAAGRAGSDGVAFDVASHHNEAD
jgi:hypothetical protein